MFHPLVFDNVKFVLEGAVYDRDLAGEIVVTNRCDNMDMAAFQRSFEIEFRLPEEVGADVKARIQLKTSLQDIASEQLELQLVERIGCTICIHYYLTISDIYQEPPAIAGALNEIWGERPHITQTISTLWDEHKKWNWPPDRYENRVTLDFHRKIDEGNIEDLPSLVEYCVRSLWLLHELQIKTRR